MDAKKFLENGKYIDRWIRYEEKDLKRAIENHRIMLAENKVFFEKFGLENALRSCIELFSEERDHRKERLEEQLKLKRAIDAALDTVADPTQRLVLRLHYIEGKTYKEIAAELDCSEINVKKLSKAGLEVMVVPEESAEME